MWYCKWDTTNSRVSDGPQSVKPDSTWIEYRFAAGGVNHNTQVATDTLHADGYVQQVVSDKDIDYASRNREKRNGLLRESDWTQMPDSPLTSEKKTEWATYRQSLRDLPTDVSDFDTAYLEDSDLPTIP